VEDRSVSIRFAVKEKREKKKRKKASVPEYNRLQGKSSLRICPIKISTWRLSILLPRPAGKKKRRREEAYNSRTSNHLSSSLEQKKKKEEKTKEACFIIRRKCVATTSLLLGWAITEGKEGKETMSLVEASHFMTFRKKKGPRICKARLVHLCGRRWKGEKVPLFDLP